MSCKMDVSTFAFLSMCLVLGKIGSSISFPLSHTKEAKRHANLGHAFVKLKWPSQERSNSKIPCAFSLGYYLLINLSLRDILMAGLCVPFTLDSEIIAMTWNFGDIYCRVYR